MLLKLTESKMSPLDNIRDGSKISNYRRHGNVTKPESERYGSWHRHRPFADVLALLRRHFEFHNWNWVIDGGVKRGYRDSCFQSNGKSNNSLTSVCNTNQLLGALCVLVVIPLSFHITAIEFHGPTSNFKVDLLVCIKKNAASSKQN